MEGSDAVTKSCIPSAFMLNGRKWRVVWRSTDDPTWAMHEAHGITFPESRQIHLCESLLSNRLDLAEAWLHELLHAALPHSARDGRPAGISDAVEEKLVYTLAHVLAPVLKGLVL